MKPHHLLAWFVCAACSAAPLAAEEDRLEQVDLKKLCDPATSEAEVVALLERHDQAMFGHIIHKLRDYRVIACPQKPDNETLRALLVRRDIHFGGLQGVPANHPSDKLNELFPPLVGETHFALPGLERLEDYWLLVFAPDGREIRPFGGDNLHTSGYVADFNHDGIIEALNSTSHGVADGYDVRVAAVRTCERKSKYLLQVVYDWHPSKADEANAWDYECFDENNDGIPEIGFGPKGAETRREVVFRWDPASGTYLAPKLGPHSHVRVLRNEAPGKELEEIKAAGGLHYPLSDATPDKSQATDGGGPRVPPPPFRFRSLKDCNDKEIARFMGGRKAPDSLQPEDAPPNTIPEKLWDMDPKSAALALVKANLPTSKQENTRLAVDDRDHVQPPVAGWLVFDSSSAADYTAYSSLSVLRFGNDQPFLYQSATSRNGGVGSNWLADRTGHSMRMVPLSPEEARFLVDILFWLERVRTPGDDKQNRISHSYSSADGTGSLDWLVENQTPRRTLETIWFVGSIAAHWHDHINEEVFLNFADFLLTEGLPAHLGKRWETTAPLNHRNLMTPLPERLQPREDDNTRTYLTSLVRNALARHRADPWPADALLQLIWCAGATGLAETLPDMEELAAKLPAPTALETEYRELARKVDRLPMFPAPDEDKKTKAIRDRHDALDEKLRYDTPCRLRESLAEAIRQLRALGDPRLLVDMANGKDYLSIWALQQLQIHNPETYADILIARFKSAGTGDRGTTFQTLAAAHPAGAKRLRATLTNKEQAKLAIELAEFESKDEPALAKSRIPALLEIFRDPAKSRDWSTRGPAIRLLADLPLDESQRARFESLLLSELKKPHRAEYNMTVLSYVMSTLAHLSDADRHWDALVGAAKGATDFNDFEHLLDSLATLAVARPDPRAGQLAEFLRPRFAKHGGMMNDLFFAALALDMRSLSPEIERLATHSPHVADDEFAHAWGGSFTGPGNRRYHAARIVSALWQETDPDTLARMWAALLVALPDPFTGDDTISTCLRDRFANALRAATPEVRKQALANARGISAEMRPDLADWLAKLPDL